MALISPHSSCKAAGAPALPCKQTGVAWLNTTHLFNSDWSRVPRTFQASSLNPIHFIYIFSIERNKSVSNVTNYLFLLLYALSDNGHSEQWCSHDTVCFSDDTWGSVPFSVPWCSDIPGPLQGQLRLIKSQPVGDTQRLCINNHSFIFQEGSHLLCWRPLPRDWSIICLAPEPQGWLSG